ncbi:MAG: metal-dependent hydrolase [Candidatus Aenigmarchaeota archaeon]
MPNYKVHQAFGIGLVVLTLLVNQALHFFRFFSFGIIELILIAIITLFYSIFADIDIGTSKSRKLVLGGGLCGIIYSFVFSQPLIGIVTAVLLLLMIFMLNHRGKTHTTLAAVIFSVPLLYMHWVYMAVACIAYLSHLLIDGELKWR